MIPQKVKIMTSLSLLIFIFLLYKPCESKSNMLMLAFAAPSRLEDNAEGVLYVNDKCISCSACKMFSPATFDYSPRHNKFIVKKQPQFQFSSDADANNNSNSNSNSDSTSTNIETILETARASMAACPVSAIRVENSAQRNHAGKAKLSIEEETLAKELILNPKLNDRPLPFPRPVPGLEGFDVHYLGHHNSASFGAVPYLVMGMDHDHCNNRDYRVSVMVDTPKFSPAAVRAVTSLVGETGPDYLLLSHVDDTADHGKWRDHFPSLKRIFHQGDLGRHNWIGDDSLEHVEILLKGITHPNPNSDDDDDNLNGWKAWNLDGSDTTLDTNGYNDNNSQFVILHTPGHSPGSITLLFRGTNSDHDTKCVLFTGDTYGFSARENAMTGFPRYGYDLKLQSQTLQKINNLPQWDAILPGHGLPRIYTTDDETLKEQDIQTAAEKLANFRYR